jgi:bacillithiol biosynthesis cysteine-adding enzyme BshC
MKVRCIDFTETGKFSTLFCDYIQQNPALDSFYALPPKIENFKTQLELRKNFADSTRTILHRAIRNQYRHLTNAPDLAIDSLRLSNTFTITTGHQLNIFTGPLYFHYKIITVINAARKLREAYPDYNFVPVYWMASEDHDADEISSFRLFGKTYIWQHEQQGAVGRFKPQSLTTLEPAPPEMHSLLSRAYQQNDTLANATRDIVNNLYGNEGLLVIDGDDPELKALFGEVMLREITGQQAFETMNRTSEALRSKGYPAQVSPREINLFYLKDSIRERIVETESAQGERRFEVLNSPFSFTESSIREELKQFPERFSPNVVLRPVYQEVILPNLAYCGGPGELAYWLQLKDVFALYHTPFPILLPRNFAMVISKHNQERMQKLKLEISHLFMSEHNLRKHLVAQQDGQNIELSSQAVQLKQLYEGISNIASQLDKSLEGMIAAEMQKTLKSIEHIEKRLQKAQENKISQEINQLKTLLNQLFPEGGLQERTDNFLNFYLNDNDFLHKVSTILDPFHPAFYVLSES